VFLFHLLRRKLDIIDWLIDVYGVELQAYPAILVKDLDDDGRRRGADAVHSAADEDGVEDQHLVPGRTERLLDDLRALTLIQEDDPRERIRQPGLVWADQTARLIHVGAQLERLPFCAQQTILLPVLLQTRRTII